MKKKEWEKKEEEKNATKKTKQNKKFSNPVGVSGSKISFCSRMFRPATFYEKDEWEKNENWTKAKKNYDEEWEKKMKREKKGEKMQENMKRKKKWKNEKNNLFSISLRISD